MNLDDLKWSNEDFANEQISKEKLLGMLHVNRHPVLKRIKIQLIIESIAWTAFLGLYYDLFDGHLRPWTWNVLLISAVGLLLIHNLLGYRVTDNPVNGSNILDSLRSYLKRIRKYAYLSIGARVFAISIIYGYFLSALEVFEVRHYWSLGFFLILVTIQVYALWRVWSERINTITMKYDQLIQNDQ